MATDPRFHPVLGSDVLLSTGGEISSDALYTTQQVAAILHVSRRTLERWRMDGSGPVITRLYPRGPPRYRGADILDAMDRARETHIGLSERAPE